MATKTAKKPAKQKDSLHFRSAPVELKFDDAQATAVLNPDSVEIQRVQLIRTGTFYHPIYGKMEITPEILKSFKENFDNRIRGVDLAIDYKHASEDVAAGWIKNLEISNNALFAQVAWTKNGKRVLMEKEFRYLSAEFVLDYQDNETLKKHGPTLLGAGLTNRPFVKGMEAVVPLSESKTFDDMSFDAQDLEMFRKVLQNLQARVEKLEGQLRASGQDPDADGDEGDPDEDLEDPNADDKGDDGQSGGDGNTEHHVQVNVSVGKKKPQDDPNKKLGEGEQMDAKQLAEFNAKLDGVIADNKSLREENKKLSETIATNESNRVLAEKKGKFDLMLAEGKACEAQREAYMKGDMEAFTAAAQPLKVKRLSAENQGDDNMEDADTAADKVWTLAEQLVKDGKAPNAAMGVSMVLADPKNRELRDKYEGKFNYSTAVKLGAAGKGVH